MTSMAVTKEMIDADGQILLDAQSLRSIDICLPKCFPNRRGQQFQGHLRAGVDEADLAQGIYMILSPYSNRVS